VSELHLAFLWHLHQPWYVDPATGRALLPWVRLHAIGAYTEMAVLLGRHDQTHATVSFSPSLLDQLERYVEGGEDDYERVTLIPAEDLDGDQRRFLVRHFFSVNWGRIIPTEPRYLELLERRGRQVHPEAWEEVTARFSPQELRDLQVLFNLAWFGVTSRKDPGVAELIRRGRDYTEEDKRTVLDLQHEVIRSLLPRWRKLVQGGAVEIACTPYHHAILPLLIDTNSAKRANPEVSLPERFSFSADAEVQIVRSKERLARAFGCDPVGLWPSEGAISPEVVPLVKKCGLRYLATDAELLFHSLDDRGSTPGRRRLYQAYHVGGTAIVFRDDNLSNRIARTYASWEDSRAAASDLVGGVIKAGERARVDGDAPPLVVVALDGENPWEAYPARGHDFLDALYRQLEGHERIKTVSLAEHLERHPPTVGLDYLNSGSWIEANFDIWIGDSEKNRAWNLLGRARSKLARKAREAALSEAQAEEAEAHLMRAEASDWFWWLGEPFFSAEDSIYESLFRSHLLALYETLGDSPPADLLRPIPMGGVVVPLRQPTSFIHPRIDGARTAYYEWRGAGFYRVPGTARNGAAAAVITGLYWGFDPGRLFLRLDPADSQLDARPLSEHEIWFELTGPGRSVVGRLDLSQRPRLSLSVQTDGVEDLGIVEEVAFREVVEVAVPLSRLGFLPGTRLGLTLHIGDGSSSALVIPRQGVIEIEIPGHDFGD
jgi:alpha-amylase/alpha-mannosidase (GH57 family)